MKFISNRSKTCPCCNGNNLIREAVQFFCPDECYFPYTCKDCGAKGEEWFHMIFVGHNVVDENDYAVNVEIEGGVAVEYVC